MARTGHLGRRPVLRGLLCLPGGVLFGSGPSSAHPADDGAGVRLSVLSTAYRSAEDEIADPFDIEVAVYLGNGSGEAVTLRGVDPPAPARARLLQRLRLFGADVEREPAFLRIDPGESVVIEPPDGRILIEGLERGMLEFNGVRLRFDFGPSGSVEALARLPRP